MLKTVAANLPGNNPALGKRLFLESCKMLLRKWKNARSIGDLVITCDEIIEETKTIQAKNTSTKTIPTKCTSTNFYILLAFLLIAIVLLISVSVYLLHNWSKQKHLLPYHDVSKLKQIDIESIFYKWKVFTKMEINK